MNFNQNSGTAVPTLINSSAVLVTGNAVSANALTVRQFGTGNVFSAQTTSGSTALFVGANGNVGIGTTNPDALLELVSGGAIKLSGLQYNTSSKILIDRSGIAGWGTVGNYDNWRFIQTTNSSTAEHFKGFNVGGGGVGIGYDPPTYSRAGADGLYVNGNVGIGTTSPSSGGVNSLAGAALDVYKSGTGVSSNVNISAGCDGSASSANKASVVFNIKGAGGGIVNGTITHQLLGSNYGFNFQPQTIGTSAMVVNGNGRVGIGINNPTAPLHVYTGVAGLPPTRYDDLSNVITQINGGNVSLVGGVLGGGQFWLQQMWTSDATFNPGIGTYAILLNPRGGGVGIGTTGSPGYPLFVNYTNSSGGVNETGIYINNTAKTNSSQMSLGGGNVYSVIAQGSFGLPSNGFSIYNTTKSSSPFNITSAGGVGIGALSPETPLDVTTTFASTGLTNSSTLWLGALTNLSGATSGANYTGSTYHAGDNNSQSLLIYAGGVYPNGAGIIQSKDTLGVRNYGQRLLLNPDGGRVGIGTTNPGTTLDVAGDVKAYNMTQLNKGVTAGGAAALGTITFVASWSTTQGDGDKPLVIEVIQTVGQGGGGYTTRVFHVLLYTYNDGVSNPQVAASTQIATSGSLGATPTVSAGGGRTSATSVTITTNPGFATTGTNRTYTIHARAICSPPGIGNLYFT